MTALVAGDEPLRPRMGWLALLTGALVVSVVASAAAVLVTGAGAAGEPGPGPAAQPSSSSPSSPSLEPAARAAATRFLDRYLEPSGRVVRRDQGGDTVSEGQSYAMLLALALGDRERFDSAWRWAVEHLGRDDGLLSWRWSDGGVADPQAAADADVDVAHALLLAADRFGSDDYRQAGLRLATSILDAETVERAGRQVLVAGPWARQGPTIVNPSYLDPNAFERFAAATDDGRWGEVAASGSEMLDRLLADRPHLVPDWAELGPDGVRPTGPPGRSAAPVFGFDAARTLVRLAASCDPADRRRAARAWPFLRGAADAGRLVAAYHLDGSPATGQRHALMYVAAAAAASAAGADHRTEPLLDAAERLRRRGPSYYGAAWVALGRVQLTGGHLGGCRS